jgi:cAMP phosphodiesterase
MIYGNNETIEILSTHLIDGLIYPNFTKENHYLKKPSVKFSIVEPFKKLELLDYKVIPVNVNHTISSIGYEISSKNGKSIFFSGDTGPGLSDIWININPKVLILDLTFPNKMEEIAINSKHLCPKLLKEELLEFYRIKDYFPEVFLLHLNPNYESEILKEINDLSKNMNIKININCQGKIKNI